MNKVQNLIEEYAGRKNKIKFFDANCWLGSPVAECLVKVPETVEELLEVMDYCGIEKAVIASSLALSYNVVYGNKRLLEDIKQNERLYGAAILLPEHTGELGNLSDYISLLTKNKVVIVKLFPKTHNFVLSDYCSGSLLQLLEERKVPLTLWHTQTSWNEIDRLCSTYSNLPIIIEGVGRKLLYDNRIFYSLLKKHKNLFLETHNLTNYLGLDDMVKKVGAEKVIFGTFMPRNDPEAALMPVVYGDFALKKKQMIAGNNLLSLITNIEK
jgi:predicted TIM-barrel fold metal-dependent hydrolase